MEEEAESNDKGGEISTNINKRPIDEEEVEDHLKPTKRKKMTLIDSSDEET